MQVIVRGHGRKHIRLFLPTGLAFSRLSAGFLAANLRKKQVNISARQLSVLFSAVKTYRKTHPEWRLLEVTTNDGNSIEIT